MIIGLLGVYGLVIARDRPEEAVTIFAIVAMMVAGLVMLWVHSCGHFIAGLFLNMNIQMIALWPWCFVLKPSKRLTSRGSWEFMEETHPFARELKGARTKKFISVLAGPVFSILVGWLAWALTEPFASPNLTWFGPLADYETIATRALFVGLNSFVWASLLHALWSLLPLVNTDSPWDGWVLMTMLLGGEQAEAACAQSVLASLDVDGVRPKDWPEEMVRAAQCDSARQVGRSGRLCLYYQALDSDPARAREAIEGFPLPHSIAADPSGLKIALERAFIARWIAWPNLAEVQDDCPASSDWRQNYRVYAMKKLAEGDFLEAMRSLTSIRPYLESASLGTTKMELDLCLEMIEWAAKGIGVAPARPSDEEEADLDVEATGHP